MGPVIMFQVLKSKLSSRALWNVSNSDWSGCFCMCLIKISITLHVCMGILNYWSNSCNFFTIDTYKEQIPKKASQLFLFLHTNSWYSSSVTLQFHCTITKCKSLIFRQVTFICNYFANKWYIFQSLS